MYIFRHLFALWALMALMNLPNSFGFVTLIPDCDSQFVGIVIKLIEPEEPINSLSKQKIVLKNVKNIKGNIGQTKQIEVLKYGNLRFEIGEHYIVSLTKEKICIAETISMNDISDL